MYREMLKHQQLVLRNVSHSEELFTKELLKSIGWLDQAEIWMLRSWLDEHFSDTHGDIIRFVFDGMQQLQYDGATRLVIPAASGRE